MRHVPQALSGRCRVGVADLIAHGPRSSEKLARATDHRRDPIEIENVSASGAGNFECRVRDTSLHTSATGERDRQHVEQHLGSVAPLSNTAENTGPASEPT